MKKPSKPDSGTPSPMALFRYRVLSQARAGELRGESRRAAIRAVVATVHIGPDERPCRVSERSVTIRFSTFMASTTAATFSTFFRSTTRLRSSAANNWPDDRTSVRQSNIETEILGINIDMASTLVRLLSAIRSRQASTHLRWLKRVFLSTFSCKRWETPLHTVSGHSSGLTNRNAFSTKRGAKRRFIQAWWSMVSQSLR